MTSKYLSRILLIAICLVFLAGCTGFARQAAQVTAEAQARTLIAHAQSLPTVTPIPSVTPIPTSTSSLLAEITDANGVTMRLVPAGEFTMGVDADVASTECQKFTSVISSCNRDFFIKLAPHKVTLSDFYMDTYEVTNAAYKRCVDTDKCAPPTQSDSNTRSVYYGKPEFDEYPVIYVDWSMAKTYCEWRGARLPTEAEWEKAARGTDGRAYPWGEGISCDKANYRSYEGNNCVYETTKVGSYLDDASPYGIYDMAGNVHEWVNDWYEEKYYQSSPSSNPLGPDSGEFHVLRGGSWRNDESYVYSASRVGTEPTATTNSIGFRCARSP